MKEDFDVDLGQEQASEKKAVEEFQALLSRFPKLTPSSSLTRILLHWLNKMRKPSKSLRTDQEGSESSLNFLVFELAKNVRLFDCGLSLLILENAFCSC